MTFFRRRITSGRIFAGLIIILIGLIFLLGNIYPEFDAGRFLGRLWPLILIVIGLLIISNQMRIRQHFSFTAGSSEHGHIVGDVRLDFSDKDIGNSTVSQVVGDLTIDLAGGHLKPGINQLDISMIVGDTLVLVPLTMPLKISARTILGDIKFDGRREEGFLPHLEHTDDGYESSQDKLFIALNGIIGDMTLQRV